MFYNIYTPGEVYFAGGITGGVAHRRLRFRALAQVRSGHGGSGVRVQGETDCMVAPVLKKMPLAMEVGNGLD
jgi:hypothetical protein